MVRNCRRPDPGRPARLARGAAAASRAGSALASYGTPETMLAMFRSGKRPDGSAVQVMPFGSLREMSDTDVRALHLYLQSLRADSPT